jgi:hypothetical protein
VNPTKPLAALAALPLTVLGLQVVQSAPAHADPCFFSAAEFGNWYDGARWGASLSTVEDQYANCAGSWEATGEVWNGHETSRRVWPRADGGKTKIVFAIYNTGVKFRAHSRATTYDEGPGGITDVRVECEFPRAGNEPCNPTT